MFFKFLDTTTTMISQIVPFMLGVLTDNLYTTQQLVELVGVELACSLDECFFDVDFVGFYRFDSLTDASTGNQYF